MLTQLVSGPLIQNLTGFDLLRFILYVRFDVGHTLFKILYGAAQSRTDLRKLSRTENNQCYDKYNWELPMSESKQKTSRLSSI